jgi:gas vesicle protein
MKSQGEILQNLVSEERLEDQIRKTRDRMKDSWTTIGMNREMGKLFEFIDHDLNNLASEARLAEKMVLSIYKRYTEDTRAKHLHPKPFATAKHVRALRDLKKRATTFRRDPRNIMTEQTLLIKRFFDTLVGEARLIHNRILNETITWPDEALLPIMQYTLEQKQLLEHQIKRIKTLSRNNKDARSQREQLKSMINDNQKQLMIAESIQRHIRKPAPLQLRQKVVNLAGYAG